MVKIGIFADVHGHFTELQQTLELLESLGVDDIICAGDLVDKGDASNEVVALIRQRGLPTVAGNHDQKALFAWNHGGEALNQHTLEYLRGLPLSLLFDWAGVRAYMCHSTPWHDASIYVSPSQPDVLFRFIAEAVEESIIVLGHSHHPMCVEMAGKLIINPGSIYENRNRRERTCGVLAVRERQFTLYDIDTGKPINL